MQHSGLSCHILHVKEMYMLDFLCRQYFKQILMQIFISACLNQRFLISPNLSPPQLESPYMTPSPMGTENRPQKQVPLTKNFVEKPCAGT